MLQSDPDAGRTPRILIADDEKNMRNTLANILTREGYHVSKAASGEEAVELCAGEDFDVVLMDVRMPGIDGVEAFRQIRRHREGVRIIMMSAYSVDELKQAALDQGAIAFLAKPLDVEQVIRLVSDVKDTTILVVEGDERTVELLDRELSKHGYKVTLTKSPHDALELVEQIRFDLIFIDAELPSMSGLDLYLAIKKTSWNDSVWIHPRRGAPGWRGSDRSSPFHRRMPENAGPTKSAESAAATQRWGLP